MNISWVLADQLVLDPLVNVTDMKKLGSLWGSWRTWRACGTANVICHDTVKANDLIKRNFHKNCNLYISNDSHITLGRPEGVNLYEGKFIDEIDQQDEIVALHLSASTSDVILLLGFDWTEKTKNPDKLIEHRAHVYRTLVLNVIKNNPNTQWVLVDHAGPVTKWLSKLDNLTIDTMESALSLA